LHIDLLTKPCPEARRRWDRDYLLPPVGRLMLELLVVLARVDGEIVRHGLVDGGRSVLCAGRIAAVGCVGQRGEVVLEREVGVRRIGLDRAFDGAPDGLDLVGRRLGRSLVGGESSRRVT
jgi:hypothetical protein